MSRQNIPGQNSSIENTIVPSIWFLNEETRSSYKACKQWNLGLEFHCGTHCAGIVFFAHLLCVGKNKDMLTFKQE